MPRLAEVLEPQSPDRDDDQERRDSAGPERLRPRHLHRGRRWPHAGCSVDSNCSAGLNGRCFLGNGITAAARLQCSYDECLKDEDCGAGKVCQCQTRGPPDQGFPGHLCVTAGCKTNGDCGTSCCSFSNAFCNVERTTGYFCHSQRDECITDQDCLGDGVVAPRDGYCAWDPKASRWSCSRGFCQPRGSWQGPPRTRMACCSWRYPVHRRPLTDGDGACVPVELDPMRDRQHLYEVVECPLNETGCE